MKVEAEVKIKILDGEEEGKVYTFTTIGHTQTSYEKNDVIERLRLQWNYIRPLRLIMAKREEGEQNGSDN